jgi:flagellar protein FlaG
MADPVTPLGGLMPGATQAVQAIFSISPRPAPAPATTKSGATSVSKESARTADQPASPESLDAAAKHIEHFLAQSSSDLRFMVDESTGQYYFKIVDSVTHETIRQVPSEELIEMARRLQELADPKAARGVIVDAKG